MFACFLSHTFSERLEKKTFADTQFIDGKLELQGQRTKSRSEREVELENEYNKMIDEFKDFDYELKPIPKPGDEKK